MTTDRPKFPLWLVLVIVGGVLGGGLFLCAGAGAGLLVYRHFQDEEEKTADCLDRLARIDAALDAYKLKHGAWPADLEILLEPDDDGSPPLLDDDEALNDPWGDPFEYDIHGLNHYGARPDVWADRHDPIGNWQLPPKKWPGAPGGVSVK